MARRTQHDLEAEITRLVPVVEVLQRYLHEQCKADGLDVSPPIPASEFVARRRDAGDTPSRILRGLEQAINDQTGVFLFTDPRDRPAQQRLLAFYRAATGRYLFDDAPDPRQKLRGILDRGHLRSRSEFRLVTALLSDGDQRAFDASECDLLRAWAADFENTTDSS